MKGLHTLILPSVDYLSPISANISLMQKYGACYQKICKFVVTNPLYYWILRAILETYYFIRPSDGTSSCPFHIYFPPESPTSKHNFGLLAEFYNEEYFRNLVTAYVPMEETSRSGTKYTKASCYPGDEPIEGA
ncbi:hypothetical protein OSB04_025983 [Centaurea solstitialis]|uniref:Uncharacterized protein n=1 Tax=Centaurea solstitialis TaxID=347529 RepID=A0AA38WF99_9ASTR|nr:hypothetical protein OSB04_025983 [Centaurea solstitialis]